MRQNRTATCASKVAYSTWKLAEHAALSIRRRFGDPVEPYRCPHCHGVHVGERKDNGRRPRVEEPA